MAVTGEGKDRNGATIRKPLLMPRDIDIPGWMAVPGWQEPAAERRQAAATDNSMASGHRRSRGKEGARPGPGLTRAERVNPAMGPHPRRGYAQAEFPGRTGCLKSERRQPKGSRKAGPQDRELLPAGPRITGPDAGLATGLERALTWAGEPYLFRSAGATSPFWPCLMGSWSAGGRDSLSSLPPRSCRFSRTVGRVKGRGTRSRSDAAGAFDVADGERMIRAARGGRPLAGFSWRGAVASRGRGRR